MVNVQILLQQTLFEIIVVLFYHFYFLAELIKLESNFDTRDSLEREKS
jgi:hypothetical protein